jgi:DNA-binding LacI/PurR family transcriptional regulator
MTSLINVAEKANVPLITAYHALSDSVPVDAQVRRAVIDAAHKLGYKLNITIRDVAHQAGVSIATVSYVLNNSAPVSTATRQKVIEAVESLGYRPNITARNLKANETRMIGYAWHNFMPDGKINILLDRFIYTMAMAAESYGYHVLTFAQPEADSVRTYEELIFTNRVDGFVVSNTNRDDARIQRLIDMKVPFASFGRANDTWDFPYVDVDGQRGTELVVEHLLERGHRDIAFIGWPEGSLNGDARFQGYGDALSCIGIVPSQELVMRTINSVDDAYHATQELIANTPTRRPTAIVCISDLIAVGAMHCLADLGFGIGEDIALTGFDDDPMSEHLRPGLTSVHQPIDTIAAQVIDLLMAEIEKRPTPNRHILMAPELKVRASSSKYFGK